MKLRKQGQRLWKKGYWLKELLTVIKSDFYDVTIPKRTFETLVKEEASEALAKIEIKELEYFFFFVPTDLGFHQLSKGWFQIMNALIKAAGVKAVPLVLEWRYKKHPYSRRGVSKWVEKRYQQNRLSKAAYEDYKYNMKEFQNFQNTMPLEREYMALDKDYITQREEQHLKLLEHQIYRLEEYDLLGIFESIKVTKNDYPRAKYDSIILKKLEKIWKESLRQDQFKLTLTPLLEFAQSQSPLDEKSILFQFLMRHRYELYALAYAEPSYSKPLYLSILSKKDELYSPNHQYDYQWLNRAIKSSGRGSIPRWIFGRMGNSNAYCWQKQIAFIHQQQQAAAEEQTEEQIFIEQSLNLFKIQFSPTIEISEEYPISDYPFAEDFLARFKGKAATPIDDNFWTNFTIEVSNKEDFLTFKQAVLQDPKKPKICCLSVGSTTIELLSFSDFLSRRRIPQKVIHWKLFYQNNKITAIEILENIDFNWPFAD